MSSSANESSYNEEGCANEALWISQDLHHKAVSLIPNYQKKGRKKLSLILSFCLSLSQGKKSFIQKLL